VRDEDLSDERASEESGEFSLVSRFSLSVEVEVGKRELNPWTNKEFSLNDGISSELWRVTSIEN
jgi:hypothetical protein